MLKILIKSGMQDRVSLVWSIVLPLVILVGGIFFIDAGESTYRFILGVLALSAMSIGLMGGAFDYFGHKESGVLKVVAISKLGTFKFLAFYALARVVVTFLILVPIVFVSVLLGVEQPVQNPFGLGLFCVHLSVVSVLLGIVCGNLGASAGAVASISNMALLFLIGTCGLFYSLSVLPEWISWVFSLFPLEVLSRFALDSLNIAFAWTYSVALILVLFLLCSLTFRYE
jgi:ABC-type multidrug transport system permease subunit